MNLPKRKRRSSFIDNITDSFEGDLLLSSAKVLLLLVLVLVLVLVTQLIVLLWLILRSVFRRRSVIRLNRLQYSIRRTDLIERQYSKPSPPSDHPPPKIKTRYDAHDKYISSESLESTTVLIDKVTVLTLIRMNNLRWRWEETKDITSSYRNNTMIHRNVDDLFTERDKKYTNEKRSKFSLVLVKEFEIERRKWRVV